MTTPDSNFGPTVRCLINEDEVAGMQSPLDKNYGGPGGAQSLSYRPVGRASTAVQMDEMITVTTKGSAPKEFHGIAMGASDPSNYYLKRSLAVIRQGQAAISIDFVAMAEGESLRPGDDLFPVSLPKSGILGLATASKTAFDASAVDKLIADGVQLSEKPVEERNQILANLHDSLNKTVTPVAQVVGYEPSSKWVKIWLYGMS